MMTITAMTVFLFIAVCTIIYCLFGLIRYAHYIFLFPLALAAGCAGYWFARLSNLGVF